MTEFKPVLFVDPITKKVWHCQEWKGATVKGYGVCGRANHLGECMVHRYVYVKYKGPIKKGYDVHHKCNNKKCGEQRHLLQVTRKLHKELTDKRDPNIVQRRNQLYDRDPDGLGRRKGGWKRRQLTDAEAVKIQVLYLTGNFTCKDLGNLFNANPATVNKIVLGKTYRSNQGDKQCQQQ